jgi:uncharacterized membrane-anchored protein YitT (DUF2179 family)
LGCFALLNGQNLLPIVLCTLLLAVGWALVLQPEPIAGSGIFGTALSGRPILPTEALRFGFAGAYLFILGDAGPPLLPG